MINKNDFKRIKKFHKDATASMEDGINTIEYWCERNKNITQQAYNDAVYFCAEHIRINTKGSYKKEYYKIHSKWKDVCRVMCYAPMRAGCFYVKWHEWSELSTEKQEQNYFNFIFLNSFAYEPFTYSIFDSLVERFNLVRIHDINSLSFTNNFTPLTERFEKQKAKVN